MKNRLVKLPGIALETEAVVGKPRQDAYCYRVAHRSWGADGRDPVTGTPRSGSGSSDSPAYVMPGDGSGGWGYGTSAGGSSGGGGAAAGSGGGQTIPGSTHSNGVPPTRGTFYMETVCVPAIPAVPGRDPVFKQSNNEGWNAGAISTSAVGGDLTLRFEFDPDSTGVMCGLTPRSSSRPEFADLTHALLYSYGSRLAIVENGEAVTYVGGDPEGKIIATITRVGGRVVYSGPGWSYTSERRSSGVLCAGALLYVASDSLENVSLTAGQSFKAHSGWGWPDWRNRGVMRGASIGWGYRASGQLNESIILESYPLAFSAGELDGGEARLVLDGWTLEAQGGEAIPEPGGVAEMWPLAMASMASATLCADMEFALPFSSMMSEEDYGEAVLELDGFRLEAHERDEMPNSGAGVSYGALIDRYIFDPVLYAALGERLRIGDEITALLTMDAALAEYLMPGDAVSATAIISALLRSGCRFSDNAAEAQYSAHQYVTNLVTGAVARYQGYDFSGFARAGEQSFAWKSDGVYRLEGANDDGATIQGLIDFAAEDFGSAELKRAESLYFGIASDGELYARVLDDQDRPAIYRLQDGGSEARAVLAKGVQSRFWRLRLEIVGATYAELDNIEWVAATTGRRMRRAH